MTKGEARRRFKQSNFIDKTCPSKWGQTHTSDELRDSEIVYTMYIHQLDHSSLPREAIQCVYTKEIPGCISLNQKPGPAIVCKWYRLH